MVRDSRLLTFLMPETPPPGPDRIVVVRIFNGQPWETVLTTLADKSSPVAYGATALYGLHRLLWLLMEWQRHLMDLRERKVHLTASEAELARPATEDEFKQRVRTELSREVGS